ncbi:hypothetical protein DRO69_13070 [Candidatus Bathyarchaeota archaeon]|nr:MAG: hypothetical protein DRO69_13070 [Candidatus Bathyarchaeota archaeon]
MIIETTDIRSSPNEQIVHAAKVIGRSKDRRKVFEAIYRGKKRVKTVDEIVEMTDLKRIRVLQEALILCNNRIVEKVKINGKLAYRKDAFYSQHKKTILRLAGNKSALNQYPTKWNPRSPTVVIRVPISRKAINIEQIFIDDIDSFHKVTKITLAPKNKNIPILEETFKNGLQKILGEEGEFNDWGGENDDIFSTRLILKGERKTVAFGLKGKGTKGKLTPKKMGTQGDQIQRLFRTPAVVFLVQYWGQISENVIEQMKAFAIMKSVLEGQKIYYGIIDGQDTLRLLIAYKDCFGLTDDDLKRVRI